MSNTEHLYLDADDLSARGWTEALIRRFLGKPDLWKPVDHFRNFTGKRTYWIERVEAVEASEEFDGAYRASLKRRKIGSEGAAAFQSARDETAGAVQAWRQQMSPEQAEARELLIKAAAELKDARQRGYRTPHHG